MNQWKLCPKSNPILHVFFSSSFIPCYKRMCGSILWFYYVLHRYIKNRFISEFWLKWYEKFDIKLCHTAMNAFCKKYSTAVHIRISMISSSSIKLPLLLWNLGWVVCHVCHAGLPLLYFVLFCLFVFFSSFPTSSQCINIQTFEGYFPCLWIFFFKYCYYKIKDLTIDKLQIDF